MIKDLFKEGFWSWNRILALFGFLILIKLFVTAIFPVIGDEAYYYYWGMHPDGGYYDLSPMIGWWEYFFTRFSFSLFWLRIPNLIAVSAVAFGVYEWLLQVVDRRKAFLIAAIYFFSPVPFFAVMISPDVPLVIFTFLSALSFFTAVKSSKSKRAWVHYAISGMLWGAAFLSKYFAFSVLPAFGLWWLYSFFTSRTKRTLSRVHLAVGLLFFALGMLPFLYQHYYWNSQHCWANIVFNWITRTKVYEGEVYQTFGLFVLYLLILATPFFWKFKSDSLPTKTFDQLELKRFSFLMWLVPISVFGLTALRGRGQGLHWYLSYVPFFFIWAGFFLNEEKLKTKLKALLMVALVLGVTVGALLSFPDHLLNWYFKARAPMDFKVAFHGDEWPALIEPYQKDAAYIFTDGYTFSSILELELNRYSKKHQVSFAPVGVWGDGSRFGRVFDWTLDFRSLEGKKLTIVTKGKLALHRWGLYFDRTEVHELTLEGVPFYVTEGYGFKSIPYLNDVFKIAVHLYYPPLWGGRCDIRD